MSDEEKTPELHVVGEEDDGITEISDDSVENHIDNGKRKLSRTLKRISDSREHSPGRISTVSLVIIIAVILALVYIIADLSMGGFLYTVNGKVVAAVYSGVAEKFSVNIDSDNVYEFVPYDDAYAILTDNGITYVNASGSISASQQITYSEPALYVDSARAIIYDRGNNSYSLLQNEALYSQQTTEGRIIDAAISGRRNYAIAVRDENSDTVLYGMNEKGKIIYQWNCPDGYISDVVLDSSGGKACVSVIDAKNAVLFSTVYILDFEYDSAYAVFEYEDETVIGTKFLSNRKILVITDKRVYLINGKEQNIVYEYGSADVCFSDFSNKYTAVVTKDYSHDDTYNLSVFGKSGKLRFTQTVNGKIRGLSVSDKSIAILFVDKTETYSNRGKLVGSIENINYYDDIIINGNYIYVVSSDSVKKLPAYGVSHVTENEEEDITS